MKTCACVDYGGPRQRSGAGRGVRTLTFPTTGSRLINVTMTEAEYRPVVCRPERKGASSSLSVVLHFIDEVA
ncbi:hypothetical protein EVAR_279_1 [Eumeta japonica]|uniref:Uncharacterized protein n=1 Tax=Eumeta variegata TaxID=151549 RepID=A0A4C1SAC9_EUMVA|nr:hypothetical protein EVAR_279_1 [Eumeta japonica]